MGTSGLRASTVHVHRRGRRSLNALAVQLSALALAFILVALLVVTSSRAAFVAQSDNATNQVSSATVQLTDNDNATAMFNAVTGLIPGQVIDRCIDVTYTGTVDPTAVRLSIAGAPPGTLGTYLDLQIDYAPDTADAYGSCASFPATPTAAYNGTLAAFATAHTGYANGVTTWDPAGGPDTRTFRFRISVQDNLVAAGLTTTFGFSWETRTS
jgi:hypothetical protein